jgi:hypothetical protein
VDALTYAEDLENARRYIWGVVRGDEAEMAEALEPYRGEHSGVDGIVRALARMVLLQAGPRSDLKEHLDHLVRALGALSHR